MYRNSFIYLSFFYNCYNYSKSIFELIKNSLSNEIFKINRQMNLPIDKLILISKFRNR